MSKPANWYSRFRSLYLYRLQIEVCFKNSGADFVGTGLEIIEILVKTRLENSSGFSELNVGAEFG